MIQRCHNPNTRNYRNYGGRGINVCNKWKKSLSTFLDDMGRKPGKKYRIERVDNNKGYYPENCKWATAQEQANNRRNTIFITCKGKTKTLSEWARILKIGYTTLYLRLGKGLKVPELFFQPIDRGK